MNPETPEKFEIRPGANEAVSRMHELADAIITHEQEIDDAREMIKAKKQEAKSLGFDVTAFNKVIKAKRASSQEPRLERERTDRLYLLAAGFQVAE